MLYIYNVANNLGHRHCEVGHLGGRIHSSYNGQGDKATVFPIVVIVKLK